MKQTEKVSVGGYAFDIEEDAFSSLAEYLGKIRNCCQENADEIIADIEERIAELFIEKCGKNGIVTIGTVDFVKKTIGNPEMMDDPQDRDSTKEKKNTLSRRLFRDTENRMLGGVCSGIAVYFNIDPVITRIIAVLLFMLGIFTGGSMIAATSAGYVILWCIIPAARTVEQKCMMNRKPIDIGEFKERCGATADRLAREIPEAPMLKSAGKIMSVIMGIIMMLFGIFGLLCISLYNLKPEINGKIADCLTGNDAYSMAFKEFLQSNELWLMILGSLILMSVWAIYSGISLTFGFRTKKWKPGLIIFVMWIISLLVIAVYFIREMIVMGLTIG